MARGGHREGSGRKRTRPRKCVPHRVREDFQNWKAVFCTFRVTKDTCNLRSQVCFNGLRRAFARAAQRFCTRLTDYAVLGNHIHVLVESKNRVMLSRAMKGLGVRIAQLVNRIMDKHGRVIEHRHHSSVLRSSRGATNVLRYMRENYRKHYGENWRTGVTRDGCSSWARNAVRLPTPITATRLHADPFG